MGRPLRALSLASLLGLVASACAEAGPGPDPLEPRLEVGTGTVRFEALEDGAEVPLTKGAQGGWHLWIAVRAEGLDTGFGSLEIIQQPADESAPPQRSTVGVRFDPPDAEGRRVYLGWPAILADPSCSVGELLRIRATLTTPTGERLTAEREVIPTGGDHPPPPCVPQDG
jgi:hypothetical protein